jgi:hypothetical protein
MAGRAVAEPVINRRRIGTKQMPAAAFPWSGHHSGNLSCRRHLNQAISAILDEQTL